MGLRDTKLKRANKKETRSLDWMWEGCEFLNRAVQGGAVCLTVS